MELKVLGSSSAGNCYLLKDSSGETFILEAGVHIEAIKKAYNYETWKVSGAFVSHEHNDHAKSAKNLDSLGIKILTSSYLIDSKCLLFADRAKSHQIYSYGKYRVMPFQVEHDANQTFGLYINHPETSPIVFITDTYSFRYEIEDEAHWLIEANYDEERYVPRRTVNSHMSLQEATKTLAKSPKPKTITLIHLSDRNSDSMYFTEYIQRKIGVTPAIADKNVSVRLA